MASANLTLAEKVRCESPASDAVLNIDLERSVHAFRSARGSKEDYVQLSRWFEIALNNMGRGLSMFDGNQRLIVCNKRYREIFSLPEALTQPDTGFADIVRYHVNGPIDDLAFPAERQPAHIAAQRSARGPG